MTAAELPAQAAGQGPLAVDERARERGAGRRDERGLSQSTESAILLAGAVTVAGLVIAAVTAFVQSRLPQ